MITDNIINSIIVGPQSKIKYQINNNLAFSTHCLVVSRPHVLTVNDVGVKFFSMNVQLA